MKGYLFKRGEVWYCRRVVKGKRVTSSLGVTTRKEAESARKELLSKVDDGAVPVTLDYEGVWDLFVRSSRRRPCSDSTLQSYQSQYDRFVSGAVALLPDLTSMDASAYLEGLRKAVGANTWNKHLNCLRYIWRVVRAESGMDLPDIWMGIPSMSAPTIRHEVFTTDQIRAMYAQAMVCDRELADIILVAAHTGLRRIDCLMLQKGSYSPDTGLLTVIPQKTRRIGSEARIGLSEHVQAALNERMGIDSEYFFPEAAMTLSRCPQTWGGRFKRFMVNTLSLNGNRALYGFHSFRHWFSTRLSEACVTDRVINTMMCHGQSKVQARYVHISAEVLREAVGVLPDITAGPGSC